MNKTADQDAARELHIYIENDADLYRQQHLPIIKNLVTKIARGTYDREKAVKLFMYLAELGAKKYARLFDSPDRWHQIFSVATRRLAATACRDEFEGEARLGNYDHLLPKKYQKTSKPAPKPSSKKSGAYRDGAEVAQRVATSLSEAEIESVVTRRHVHVPSGTHVAGPEFRRGYLQTMRNILDAMRGN